LSGESLSNLVIGHAHNVKTIAPFTLADFKAIPFVASTKILADATQKQLSTVCINLQADFVGVTQSFARICTSRLKVKQKAKIINCRSTGSYGELLVCFAAKLVSIS